MSTDTYYVNKMKNSKKLWIALALVFLLYHNTKAQEGYIGLHVRSDTIALDSAIVMDLNTYRSIRNYNLTSDEVVASKITLIHALENQVAWGDSIIASLRSKVEKMSITIHRKDELIGSLNVSFEKLDSLGNQTIDLLQESLNKRNPLLSDERLWIGVGVGIIAGIFLMR